jgi:hypothetical protein
VPNPCPTPPPGDTLTLGSHTYAREGWDTFTKDAHVGSFAQGYVADASLLHPVYVGDHGLQWSVYADGWPSTYTVPPYTPQVQWWEGYQPSTVLSVHDGVLDFYLHGDANGHPVGASLSPWPNGSPPWPAGGEYQTYGVWSFCQKVPDPQSLGDFYEDPMLWPQNDGAFACAESDFPETYGDGGGSMTADQIWAFAHYGCQAPHTPEEWNGSSDLSPWHVFTQEWGPRFRSYYVDGQLVYTATEQVYSQPERWQLQVEPSPSAANHVDGDSGHVYVAWVWIGTPDY